MKKLTLLLALLLLPLTACTPNKSFVDQHILPVLDKLTLNDVQYANMGDETITGSGRLTMVDQDTIGYLFAKVGTSILFTIYIETKRINSFDIWSFDIMYYDNANRQMVYWEFMHYGQLFVPNYKPETINMNHKEYAENLLKLTNNDLVYLIKELEKISNA